MKRVVIELSEDDYNFILNNKKIMLFVGKQIGSLIQSVCDGTVLPDKCGRLIDANELLEKWDNLSKRGRTEFDQEIICMATVFEGRSN